jgi:hypothetical protein
VSSGDGCELCGHSIDEHDRNIRFVWPDPVVNADALPGSEVWVSGADPNSSVMMQVNGIGAFIRALLPVKLTGGYAITYGVWIGIDPNKLQPVLETWWSPSYRESVLDGRLANRIERRGLLAAPVGLGVRDEDSIPFCLSRDDDRLGGMLSDEWNHELVLTALS